MGMKLSTTNPGKKTFLLLALLLAFFIVMALVLKSYTLPAISIAAGRALVSKWLSKPGDLLPGDLTRSP